MAEITITWQGVEYTIPANRAFQIGERIEDIATLGEIYSWLQQPKFFRMARCLGEMLRFAGCKVSNEEVHRALVSDEEGQSFAAAIFSLIDMLMGDAPKSAAREGQDAGKPAASSKTPSRSRSSNSKSSRANSGK